MKYKTFEELEAGKKSLSASISKKQLALSLFSRMSKLYKQFKLELNDTSGKSLSI